MTESDLKFWDGMEGQVERAAEALGLTVTMKGTLKSYPGSIHWHFKRGGAKGVLEITVWPKQSRAWIAVQDGRKAEWIEEVLPEFVRQLSEEG